ncbi:MAG: FkbM family methyltransferase [Rhodothermia bacterium]
MAVRRAVRPGELVLDIGAHAGYYTLLFSRLVGASGAVFSFEPDPINFAVLRHNLRGSETKNVGTFNLAVSDRCGPVCFHRSAGSGNHSLFPYTEPVEITTVESTTIDAFLAARARPEVALIKLDIEGAEILALTGMRETLERYEGVSLVVEYNPRALDSAGESPENLLRTLRSLGFQLWRLELDKAPEPVGPCFDPEPQGAINLFCSRLGPPGAGRETGVV